MARKMTDEQKAKMKEAREAAKENPTKTALPVFKVAKTAAAKYVKIGKVRIPRTTAPSEVGAVVTSIVSQIVGTMKPERIGGSLTLYAKA